MPSTLPGALALYGGLIAWIALVLTALGTRNNFRVELELHHAELWKRLGSPAFTRRFMKSGWKFESYLICGRYRDVGDPALTRLGDRARWVLAVWYLVSLALFIEFIVATHR